jgi:hypothetical protein
MAPARDDLDERVWRAARPEAAAVERVVAAALACTGQGPDAGRRDVGPSSALRQWPAAFGVITGCLIAVAAVSVWWCARAPERTGGYRATALPMTADTAPGATYRVTAIPPEAPRQPITVTADGGATWILSATPGKPWLPPGSSVVAGGEQRK